jgi:DNA-binding NtrC family response regulator
MEFAKSKAYLVGFGKKRFFMRLSNNKHNFMTTTSQNNIVILETNQMRRDCLRSIISRWGYSPFSFDKETICLDNLSTLNPGLVISGDLSLERTFRFVNSLKMKNRNFPVLIISGDYAIHNFIEISLFDDIYVINTPIDPNEIKMAIRKIQGNRLKSKMYQDCPMLIGNSLEMQKIKKMVLELSRCNETVIVQGETGTGKELVARAIHFKSDRRNKPFIKINTFAFSHESFKNMPSGFNQGAFSDAEWNLESIFEVANTGTVFLDHVEKLPASSQTKLLQVLDTGSFSTLFNEKKKTVDVRIIASACTDLGILVEKGKFRKDLFYRLNVIRIDIPPLRNRIQDILTLAVFFNDMFCGDLGRSHFNLSKKTKNILSCYHWPENVRELENVVRHSVLMGNENSILDKVFMPNQRNTSTDHINFSQDIYTVAELSDIKKYLKDLNKVSLKDICREFITRAEKKIVKQALENTNWNRKKASILLDISYKSLLNKIKAYDLA